MKNIYLHHMLTMPASLHVSILQKNGWDILKIRSILCWKIKIRKQIVDKYIMPDPETKARCFIYFNFFSSLWGKQANLHTNAFLWLNVMPFYALKCWHQKLNRNKLFLLIYRYRNNLTTRSTTLRILTYTTELKEF